MLEELATMIGYVDIINITESHLRKDISDAEGLIKGYRLFRGDRTECRKKGGVAVYVKEHLAKSTYVLDAGSNGETECYAICGQDRNHNYHYISAARLPDTELSQYKRDD